MVLYIRSFLGAIFFTTITTGLPGTWTSLGCYIVVGRTLTDGGYDMILGMTDESCIAYCDAAVFNYVGTGEDHL